MRVLKESLKHTIMLHTLLESKQSEPMGIAAKELISKGWIFCCVDQKRGRCYYDSKIITIPLWAISKNIEKPDYLSYYLSHEIAHAVVGIGFGHGEEFMQAFKRICPKHVQYHELAYKPKYAIAAGITAEDF